MSGALLRASAGPPHDLDLGQLLLVLWRHKWLIALVAGTITTLSYFYINTLTPRYTAEAVLVLDARKANVGIDPVVADLRPDATVIRSEVQVLRSQWLVRRVVEELGLMADPEFNPSLRPAERGWRDVVRDAAWLPAVLREQLGQTEPERTTTPLIAVMGGLLSRLNVANDGRSYTVQIFFDSEDPEKAARIVNAVADLYLAGQRENKYEAAERGAQWLEEKIQDLRVRLQAAETAVLEYREKNDLLEVGDAGSGTVLARRLAQVASDLVRVRSERLAAEAQVENMRGLLERGAYGDMAPAITGANEFDRLLADLRTSSAVLSELGKSFGDSHPDMIAARAQHGRLQMQLRLEAQRVMQSLEARADLARLQEAEFGALLQELEQQNTAAQRLNMPLKALLSEAEAARSLLSTFLASSDRTSLQLDLLQPDARILSHAETPPWPSYPQRKILLAIALVGSTMIGVMVAALIELLNRGFRGIEQVETALALPVFGLTPMLRRPRAAADHPSALTLQSPYSAFGESIRLIRSALRLGQGSARRVLLVTSAVPDEGKTCLALALARQAAASGSRVVLIDCDLRAPSVATDLGVAEADGLAEILCGTVDPLQAMRVDPVSGLRFIAAGHGRFAAVELLNSWRMRELVATASRAADLVILDSPPAGLVSDAVVLSRIADAVIMVIRWDRTPRTLVEAAVKRLREADAPLAGVVLAQVNLSRHSKYGLADFPHGYQKGYLTP